MRFGGSVAVVTGAAGGIGAAVCARLKHEGAHTAALDVQAPQCGDLNLICDISDSQALEAAAQRIARDAGVPDIVVHSAAITEFADAEHADAERFSNIMKVNVWAAAALARQFAPGMRTGGRGGNFVLVSSITGIVGAPGMASYSASKGALITLARTLALELAPDGIRVNCVCPASVDTPMLRAAFERQPDPQRARELNVKRHPLGRLGTPEDVAALVCFLASSDASWITGSTYVIDGGASIARRWQE